MAWAIARAPASGRWIWLKLEDLDSGRPPLSQTRGLVRIARSRESDAGDRRLVFTTRETADECARRLAEHPGAVAQLRELGGIAGVQLPTWTAAELDTGSLKILWRRRQPIVIGATPAAPRPSQAPRRTVAPSSPTPPTPEYSTFPPGLDALAVAQVLKDAAKDGVPFCEECMKAAMQEYSTFPPSLDAAAVAQVLKDAAKDGVPFCEECMKAQSAETA